MLCKIENWMGCLFGSSGLRATFPRPRFIRLTATRTLLDYVGLQNKNGCCKQIQSQTTTFAPSLSGHSCWEQSTKQGLELGIKTAFQLQRRTDQLEVMTVTRMGSRGLLWWKSRQMPKRDGPLTNWQGTDLGRSICVVLCMYLESCNIRNTVFRTILQMWYI